MIIFNRSTIYFSLFCLGLIIGVFGGAYLAYTAFLKMAAHLDLNDLIDLLTVSENFELLNELGIEKE